MLQRRLPPGLRAAAVALVPVLLGACAARSNPGSAPAPERDLSGFVDVEVATVAVDLEHGHPLALLHEDWNRTLPVWIGNEEALAIARARDGLSMSRPLTHDLFVDILGGLGGTLEEVLIYDLRDDVYYGLLRVRVDGEVREFDTRPSDGLALAVRTGARIRVDPRLLDIAPEVDFVSLQGERPIVSLRGITVSSGSPGVLVLRTAGVSPSRSVRPGDVILSVDGRDVDSPWRFMDVVQGRPDDASLRLKLVREGTELEVRVRPAGPALRS